MQREPPKQDMEAFLNTKRTTTKMNKESRLRNEMNIYTNMHTHTYTFIQTLHIK